MRLCRFSLDELILTGFYADDHVIPIDQASETYCEDLGVELLLPTTEDLLDLLPPEGCSSHAVAELARWVDGTLLVATAGETTRREFHRAHEVLRQVDARLLGTVLNGVGGDAAYGYTYGYRYAYAYGEPQSKGRKGRQAAPTA